MFGLTDETDRQTVERWPGLADGQDATGLAPPTALVIPGAPWADPLSHFSAFLRFH